ncbi:MAG: glycosyltransferase family 4 protein [Paludibacteraceae bacterium]
MKYPNVLVVATSHKTRGGIAAVVRIHKSGKHWDLFHCHWIETHRDGTPIYKLWYLFIALAQYLVLLPFYDIVHIHIATRASARRKQLFLYPAKWLQKKVILHFHPPDEKFLTEQNGLALYQKLFDMADLVLVLSTHWQQWIQQTFAVQTEIKVLYNPYPKVNRRDDLRQENILFAGVLIDKKGYEVLIRAFARIHPSHPHWRLVFAGSGEIQKAQNLIAELGIDQNVDFLGWVQATEKENAFHNASIFCLPSDGEGFPMAVLDAWAYGIPCVMTPVGGIPDVVKDGVNGMLFPIRDDQVLAEKLEILVTDKERRAEIVSGADKLIKKMFDIDQISKALDKIYTELS